MINPKNEIEATVEKFIKCLPLRERLIFELHFFEKIPIKEIASAFNISYSTAKRIRDNTGVSVGRLLESLGWKLEKEKEQSES